MRKNEMDEKKTIINIRLEEKLRYLLLSTQIEKCILQDSFI